MSSFSTLPRSNLAYRPDIDGMRAIAVLAVVLFHIYPRSLPTGFIGVDVFFVISGYLITRIILQSRANTGFDWSGFYRRRVMRIFPVLLTVLACTFALAWLVMFDHELMLFGKHLSAGVFFLANLMFWSESGYFDTAAETKPLLHLWSLGIEEQFYLFWPLLLLLVLRYRRHSWIMLSSLAFFSLVLCIVWGYQQPSSGFYLPQSRAWELMAGAFIALASQYSPRLRGWAEGQSDAWSNLQSVTGAVCLLLGFYLIDQDQPFPGYWAALPVIGASLLILAGPASLFNRAVLSQTWLTKLGLLSFSWYLWHWPLLSFARIIATGDPAPRLRNTVFIASLLLALASYYLIERPLRRSRSGVVLCTVLLLWLSLGLIGWFSMNLPGDMQREVMRINPINAQSGFDGGARELSLACDLPQSQRDLFLVCARDYRGNVRYALIGDSKAHAMYQGLVRTSDTKGRWMFVGGTRQFGATLPVISDAPEFAPYQTASRLALKIIENDPELEVVVFVVSMRALFQLSDGVKSGQRESYDHRYLSQMVKSSSAEAALHGLRRAIVALQRAGKQVVFVLDNPPLPEAIDCAGRKTASVWLNRWLGLDKRGIKPECYLSLQEFQQASAPYLQLIQQLKADFPRNFSVFDTAPLYCDTVSGVCGPVKNQRLMYSYTDHISDYAAGLVGRELNPYLDALVNSTDR